MVGILQIYVLPLPSFFLLRFTKKVTYFFDMQLLGECESAEYIRIGVAKSPKIRRELVTVGFMNEQANSCAT